MSWNVEEVMGADPLHPLNLHYFLTVRLPLYRNNFDMESKGKNIDMLFKYQLPETTCLLPLLIQVINEEEKFKRWKNISLLFILADCLLHGCKNILFSCLGLCLKAQGGLIESIRAFNFFFNFNQCLAWSEFCLSNSVIKIRNVAVY